MLKCTKLCIKCIGRLHQLYEFNRSKENNDKIIPQNNPDESGVEMNCQICCQSFHKLEMIPREMNSKIVQIIKQTLWQKVIVS